MADAGTSGGLREQVERLEQAGLLRRVTRRVDPRFELAAVADAFDRGPALLFEDVAGYDLPVVIGTEASRRAVEVSLGLPGNGFCEHYIGALSSPIAPALVDRAPVQEIVRTGDEVDLLGELPVLTHHEHDAGPYITSGVVIAEDRERGVRNLSYHRMQVLGPRETAMVIVPRHLDRLRAGRHERGEPLPVAVVVGLDAATRIAAGTSGAAVPFGYDELGLAGALKGRPEPVVLALTVPVHVPALAEIVLEGEVLPDRMTEEGPFAEFDGTYEKDSAYVFRVTALTRRRGAIYQGLISGSREQLNLMGLANEPVILRAVRATVPGARRIHVTAGGLRKFHVVLSIDKRHDGDGMDAILAVMAAHRDVKHVVVVDDDVDPFDSAAVEWAIATRFQAGHDLLVVPSGKGNPVDKSQVDGSTARMGLDATVSLARRVAGAATPAVIPGRDRVVPAEWLN